MPESDTATPGSPCPEPPEIPQPVRNRPPHHAMVSLHKLTKRFGIQTAVNALSLEIPAGQIVGLLGPNGAGKTTTLRMLSGLLEPSAGSATIAGHDLSEDPLKVVEKVCDRVLIIDEGTLKADGAPAELVRAHRAESLEQLFTELTAKSDVARKAEDFARTFQHAP